MPIEHKKNENTTTMTQNELDIKKNELYRAYCAKTEPIKRQLAENDIKTREARQGISRLYEEVCGYRDKRVELEHQLFHLNAEYLEEKIRLMQAFESEQEPAPEWHPVTDTPDHGKLILCLGPDSAKPWVEKSDDYSVIASLKQVTRWRYLDGVLPSSPTD